MQQVSKYTQNENRTTINLVSSVDHIDMSNISTFINQPPANEVLEILCPHMQLRDCVGQLAIDVNNRSKTPVFNVTLVHSKRFSGGRILESWLVVLETLAAPTAIKTNRKQRRTKQTKKRK